MKRNILVSLMIIGAVAALVSGATFSAFSDSATVSSGTLTTGTVEVTLGSESFTWDPTTCESAPLNSNFSCSDDITVTYLGTLAATVNITGTVTESTAGCFAVDWSPGGDWTAVTGDIGAVAGADLLITTPASQTGAITVTVTLDPSVDQSSLTCQGATISLTLTVAAEEELPT